MKSVLSETVLCWVCLWYMYFTIFMRKKYEKINILCFKMPGPSGAALFVSSKKAGWLAFSWHCFDLHEFHQFLSRCHLHSRLELSWRKFEGLPYSCEQKHVLLFRKSTLKGFLKPRHVTKKMCFYSEICHAYTV